MFTHLFYISGLVFVIHELNWLLNPKEKALEAIEILKLEKQNANKKWDDFSDDFKSKIKSKSPTWIIIYMWLFIGLLTVQWLGFLAFLVFMILTATINNIVRKNVSVYAGINWVFSLVGFAFGVFIIVNHYHLHIDLYHELKSWLR